MPRIAIRSDNLIIKNKTKKMGNLRDKYTDEEWGIKTEEAKIIKTNKSVNDKFAVLVPITNQIGYDTFKYSYKTIILSKNLNIEQIMVEVHKIAKDAKIENLHFTEIIQIN